MLRRRLRALSLITGTLDRSNGEYCGWSAASLGDPGGDGLPCDLCDMNCYGTVDASDIEFFIDILFNGATPCNFCTADTNGDGNIDAADIEGFINCLFP